ncbi:hypothetical protein [Melissococcus plutonius]|uniref:hypothetical protein n=1 Tax=Melissococcus plutonius TaxID=33970 RepID=UPI003C2FB097
MTDIVQLKEDGKSKYLKTHVNAIDGVNGELVSTQGDTKIIGKKDFEHLTINGRSPQTGSYQKGLKMADIDSDNVKSMITESTFQFNRVGDITTVSGRIITNKGFGSNSYVLYQVPYGYRTIRANGNTSTPLMVSSWGTAPVNAFSHYSWENERLVVWVSEARTYYFTGVWSSAGTNFPDE